MSRVYAPTGSAGKLDLRKVKRFGPITYVVDGGHQSALLNNIHRTVDLFHDQLEHFSDQDYILPIGNPTLIAVMSAIAMHYNGGQAMFLHWDKKQSDYIPVCVGLFD